MKTMKVIDLLNKIANGEIDYTNMFDANVGMGYCGINEYFEKYPINENYLQEKNIVADGRTEREKYLEQRCEELENRIRKMEIENNLMRELLSRPVSYTYGVR